MLVLEYMTGNTASGLGSYPGRFQWRMAEDQSWTTGSRAGLHLCFAGSSNGLLNDLLPRYVECDVFSFFPNENLGHPDMPLLIPAVVRAL